jgi:DNA-binding MarR family transcriptional regulator
MYHTAMSAPKADQVARAILETVPPAMRAIREQMRSARAAGLSVAQFRLLLFVRRHPGTNLSAAAEHMGTSLPAASQLVSRLVAAGMIARVTRPTERRHIQLRLTDVGRAALEACDIATRDWICVRLGQLDDASLERLEAAMGDLRVILDARDGQGIESLDELPSGTS